MTPAFFCLAAAVLTAVVVKRLWFAPWASLSLADRCFIVTCGIAWPAVWGLAAGMVVFMVVLCTVMGITGWWTGARI